MPAPAKRLPAPHPKHVSPLVAAWQPIFERVRLLRPTACEAVAWAIALRRAARRAGAAPVETRCPICIAGLVASLPGGATWLVAAYEQALREVDAAERNLHHAHPAGWVQAEAA